MVQLFVHRAEATIRPIRRTTGWPATTAGCVPGSDAIDRGIAEGTMKEELPKAATISTAIAVLDGLQQSGCSIPRPSR